MYVNFLLSTERIAFSKLLERVREIGEVRCLVVTITGKERVHRLLTHPPELWACVGTEIHPGILNTRCTDAQTFLQMLAP